VHEFYKQGLLLSQTFNKKFIQALREFIISRTDTRNYQVTFKGKLLSLHKNACLEDINVFKAFILEYLNNQGLLCQNDQKLRDFTHECVTLTFDQGSQKDFDHLIGNTKIFLTENDAIEICQSLTKEPEIRSMNIFDFQTAKTHYASLLLKFRPSSEEKLEEEVEKVSHPKIK
jgi:hypothetical protein